MTKEDFIKAGYVNFGYISPALSSESTYPEYIMENVARAIERLKKIHKDDQVSFVFMTDLHYSVTANHDIRTRRLMNAYQDIKKETGIEMMILGGDYVNDGTKDYKLRNYRALREYLKDEKWFPVNGNHDDNSIWDDDFVPAGVDTQHLTREERYVLFYNHVPSQGAVRDRENPGLYY